MKHKIKTLLCSFAFIAATASQAQAYGEPYCREYTETFQIGGRTQQGFGTACLQPDGSWEKQGTDNYEPTYEQQKQNVVYVIDRQPVEIYRPYRPLYRQYSDPRPYYTNSYAYAQPSSFFSFSFGDSGYHPHRYYERNSYYINKRGHGHGHGHGRGHGRVHGHGRGHH